MCCFYIPDLFRGNETTSLQGLMVTIVKIQLLHLAFPGHDISFSDVALMYWNRLTHCEIHIRMV